MAMQGYGTAPSRNKSVAASAPKRRKGIIEKEMMPMRQEMGKKPMPKKAMPKKMGKGMKKKGM